MTKSSTKHKLLSGTSAIAFVAASVIFANPALAAPPNDDEGWVTLAAPENVTQVAAASTVLTAAGANVVSVTGGIAADNTNQTATGIVVNATSAAAGLLSTGDFSTVSVSGTGTITTAGGGGIVVTKGTIDGKSTTATKGTISINGAAATLNIDNSANGTISNTGAGGNAIWFGNNAATVTTITNNGAITATDNSASYAIKSLAGNTVNITNNSGATISAGSTGTAISFATTAHGVVTNAGTGAITGAVDLGTAATSILNLNGNSTLNGNVTMGHASQQLNLNGGQLTGTVTGPGLVNATVDYTSIGNIGTGTAVTTLTVTDGKIFSANTNNNTIAATNVVLGTAGAGGATLNLGTGAVTGAIDGDADGKGVLNFKASNTTNGAIGGTHGLATINVTDGTTLNTATNNNAVKATTINVGTSTAGATWNVGTGAITGAAVESSADGVGAINFKGNQTLGAGTTIGATTKFATVTVSDGAALTANTNNNTIKATNVVLGTAGAGTGTLSLGTGSVTGLIDGDADGKGVLNFKGNNTIVNNIGATHALSSVVVSDGKTVHADTNNNSIKATAVTLGTAGAGTAALTLGTGLVTGTIDGDADGKGVLTYTASQTLAAASAIGNTHALATININDGVTVDNSTNNNVIKATNVTVGSAGAGTAVLTLGTAAVTGAIDGDADGKGVLNFKASNTTNGAIGGTHGLATINVTDGTTLNTATNNNAVKATTINVGTSTAGATWNVGTGAITGAAVESSADGVGAINFKGNQTLGAGTTIGATTKFATVTVSDGAALTANTNNNTIKATNVVLGTAGAGTGTLSLGTGSVTGLIDGDADGKGVLNFKGNNTIVNNIGATHALSSVVVSDGKTVHADTNNNSIKATAVTLGTAGAGTAALTLGTGLVTGTIDGDADGKGVLTYTASQTLAAASAIGNTHALATININDGVTVDNSTNNNVIKATNVTVGSAGAGTAVLTLGTAAVTGAIDGDADGKGVLNFKASNTTNGAIGGTHGLATINVTDGTTLNTATNNNAVKATTINVGTSTAGATWNVGTGAITGAAVESSADGVGAINFKGNQTLGAGTTIGATTKFATVTVSDGAALTANTNNNTIKATNVVLGTAGAGTGTLSLGTGSVTGLIDGDADGKGVLNFKGNNTIVNNIGATHALSSVVVSDGKTVHADTNNNSIKATAVTLGTAGAGTAALTLGTGLVTGTIDGDADGKGVLTYTASQTLAAASAIGNTHALATININDGVTVDNSTNNNVIKATNVTVGSAGAGTAVLTLGTAAVTGAIDGDADGKGVLNFKASNTLGGAIGGTHNLATVNITDGTTTTMGANNISATNINIGTSSSGATLLSGGGTITGLINSASAGTGTLRVADGATTVLGTASTIGATTKLGSVIVGDGSTLTDTNNNSINATTVQLGRTAGGTGTLNLGTGAVNGAITTISDDKGVLGIAGTQTLLGDVGASGAALHQINLTNGTLSVGSNSVYSTLTKVTAAKTIALNTGVVHGDIDGAAANAGIATFSGTQTTAGAIGDVAAGGGNGLAQITFGSGSNVTLGAVAADVLHATAISVADGGRVNFGGTARTTHKGDIDTAGTAIVDLGTQTQTLLAGNGAGNFTTTAGGQTINVGVRDNTTNHNGNLVIAGDAVIHASTLLYVDTSAVTGYIADGTTEQWLSATGNNNSAVLVSGNVSTSNPLFTATESVVAGAGGTRTLTLHRVAGGYAGVATTGNGIAAGTVLEALGVAATTDAQIAPFLGRVDGATSAANLTNIINEVTPQINGTSIQAVQSTTQSMNVVGTRLTQLRAGIDSSSTGMAAGGRVADKGLWLQGFGTTATQDLRGGVDGYDADTIGGAVGADMAVSDNTRLGASVSYARSSVDSSGVAIHNTDIDSYQVNAYGSYNMGQWYTDGLLGFAYHSYDSDHTIVGTGVANGDFNGETYTARAGGGYRLMTGNGIDVTPNGSLTYYYNHVDGYTETGAGGLNNHVGDSNTNALVGRIGADIGYSYNYGSMLVRPVLRAAYMYDFVGDRNETTAFFTGGGATYKVRDASPERSSVNLGASLNIARTDNISFSADYDYQGKSDYDSHSGVLRARYNF